MHVSASPFVVTISLSRYRNLCKYSTGWPCSMIWSMVKLLILTAFLIFYSLRLELKDLMICIHIISTVRVRRCVCVKIALKLIEFKPLNAARIFTKLSSSIKSMVRLWICWNFQNLLDTSFHQCSLVFNLYYSVLIEKEFKLFIALHCTFWIEKYQTWWVFIFQISTVIYAEIDHIVVLFFI